jgi:23S rRNA pseudouridine1911/1915/1917 synthase
VLDREKGKVLYEFSPDTGRSHQLRACAAALGTPLLGDLKYGARSALPDGSIALHAAALEVEHPTRKEPIRFETPEPWVFRLSKRRGSG